MTKPTRETIAAFCTHDEVHIEGAATGPLTGLTFAVKDIFSIAGRTACCGNPDWLATHAPAKRTAPSVTRLLDAGATLAGMTITEELVMGLTGENPFYGTPVNIAAPGRVPGGSSSGSAAAVTAGLVDFALGSDTGGSVRVPASFCGIYGMRPSFGRVPIEGVMPFAPSLDTVGWLARNATLLRRVGDILLSPQTDAPSTRPGRFLIATDAFAVVDDEIRAALAPAIGTISELLGTSENVVMAGEDSLSSWSELLATFREAEGWASHRDWIEECRPTLSENGAIRMKKGSGIGVDALAAANQKREGVRARMNELLSDSAVLAVPAAPNVAPECGGDQDSLWKLYNSNAQINGAASLAGLPQLSLPLATLNGLPIGLGLIAAPGRDELLLTIAEELAF